MGDVQELLLSLPRNWWAGWEGVLSAGRSRESAPCVQRLFRVNCAVSTTPSLLRIWGIIYLPVPRRKLLVGGGFRRGSHGRDRKLPNANHFSKIQVTDIFPWAADSSSPAHRQSKPPKSSKSSYPARPASSSSQATASEPSSRRKRSSQSFSHEADSVPSRPSFGHRAGIPSPTRS